MGIMGLCTYTRLELLFMFVSSEILPLQISVQFLPSFQWSSDKTSQLVSSRIFFRYLERSISLKAKQLE